MHPVHVIIATHTPRHLRRTLLGVLAQSVRPASVTVSCDTDDPAIRDLVAGVALERDAAITLVQRPSMGASRSSQVRNNAVRTLLAGPHTPDDLLWFLDGDCIPAHDCLSEHLRLAGRDEGTVFSGPPRLVIAFRIDLTPEQTDAIDEEAIIAGRPFVQASKEQRDKLAERHRRYERHAFLHRFRMVKPHKPKLLSANFSVVLTEFLDVNGFDEMYTGYGQEDDDLGRRLYESGVRPIIGVENAIVFHQHHATRAPGAWEKSPNAARFLKEYTARCPRGVDSPLEQPEPVVTTLGPAPSPPSPQ